MIVVVHYQQEHVLLAHIIAQKQVLIILVHIVILNNIYHLLVETKYQIQLQKHCAHLTRLMTIVVVMPVLVIIVLVAVIMIVMDVLILAGKKVLIKDIVETHSVQAQKQQLPAQLTVEQAYLDGVGMECAIILKQAHHVQKIVLFK